VGEQALDHPALQTVQPAGPGRAWVYRLAAPAPRIYLARRLRLVSSPLEAVRVMSDDSFKAGEDCVLLDMSPDWDRGELASGSLRVVDDGPGSLSLEVEATGTAMLVVADSFFPGWQAAIDGRTVPILRANGGLARALQVPAGRHSITMVYRPDSVRLGLEISAAALIALAVVLRFIPAARAA
jgi:hypothetical protein